MGKSKLENLIDATALTLLIAAGITSGLGLGYMFYDTLKASVEITREAEKTGKNVYDICKEKGRTDVYDMFIIQECMEHCPIIIIP